MSLSKGGKATYATVDVGSTAKLVVAGRSDRKSALVQNTHATRKLWIATSSTLAAGGSPHRNPGKSVEFDDYNGDIFAISTSTGTSASYIETYD